MTNIISKLIVLFLGISIGLSCTKDVQIELDEYHKVLVLHKGIDCGNSYLIQFQDPSTEIPANNWKNVFYENNLNEGFKNDSTIAWIKFRELKIGEGGVCSSLGPGYPHIYILDAKHN
jgi:hypothetical protein